MPGDKGPAVKAVTTQRGDIVVDDVEDVSPGPGQVLVAPLACGICGSDLHLVESQAAMPDLIPTIVLGHEFVGELLDFGPDTERRLKPGSIVTSMPYLEGADGAQLIGLSPSVTGGLAERMVLQERRLIEVPCTAEAIYAALTEPLAVGAHAVGVAQMQPTDVALVVGCGPVGLAVIVALKANGYGPVVAAELSPRRRALAESVGADVVIDPAESSPYSAWTQLAGPALPPSPLLDRPVAPNTVLFECVGAPGVLSSVINSVAPHTRVVIVGVCTQPEAISPAAAVTKELSLRFSFAYRPQEFAEALRWITDGTVDVKRLVTAIRPLDDAPNAFDQLRGAPEQCKILLGRGATESIPRH